jgi:fibrillarin-like rRNA methylase
MKIVGLLMLVGGIGSILYLGAQDGRDAIHVMDILVGQALGAMAACLGGVLFAH